jgi:hypothetical protein
MCSISWHRRPVSSIDELHRLLTVADLEKRAEVTVLRRSKLAWSKNQNAKQRELGSGVRPNIEVRARARSH